MFAQRRFSFALIALVLAGLAGVGQVGASPAPPSGPDALKVNSRWSGTLYVDVPKSQRFAAVLTVTSRNGQNFTARIDVIGGRVLQAKGLVQGGTLLFDTLPQTGAPGAGAFWQCALHPTYIAGNWQARDLRSRGIIKLDLVR